MKTKRIESISDIARTNSQFAKKLAKYNADPNRFYFGAPSLDEDSADYLKIGVIKAVRLA